MPSPRTCRRCTEPLLPDLPWCPACYEQVRQFAARAPLHHGDFVGSPMPTRCHIPHRSRWEKSATTFGPTGRVVATVILLSTLLPAISWGNIVHRAAPPTRTPHRRDASVADRHLDSRVGRAPALRLRAGSSEGGRARPGRDRSPLVVLPGVHGSLISLRRLRRSRRTDVRVSGSRGSLRTAARGRSPARTPA